MKSGAVGVTWSKRHGKWRADCKVDGKHVFLGLYDDVTDATAAAHDFRLEMSIPRKIIKRRGNESRSRGVKKHKEKLSPEVLRAISLKAHANRQGLLRSNKSGVEGISWNKRHKRWFVQVRKDGVKKRLGSYAELDEAIAMTTAFYETGEDPRLTSS